MNERGKEMNNQFHETLLEMAKGNSSLGVYKFVFGTKRGGGDE